MRGKVSYKPTAKPNGEKDDDTIYTVDDIVVGADDTVLMESEKSDKSDKKSKKSSRKSSRKSSSNEKKSSKKSKSD